MGVNHRSIALNDHRIRFCIKRDMYALGFESKISRNEKIFDSSRAIDGTNRSS